MSNPIITVVAPALTMTGTPAVEPITVVNRWYVQPEPSVGSGWLFNDVDNSAHMMLTWD
jgi:hypothetical protein